MQSQIEYELDVLKSGNYDQALQFIEHLVNVLVRMANALTDNEKITNRVPQQEDDNFWGYTFNFIAKVVDLDLSLEEQDEETMLWTRDPYIEGAFSLLRHVELHPDFRGKTIVSGHTPTTYINGNDNNVTLTDMPHDLERHYVTRYFIDGGSKSGSINGRINVLVLDEKGYEVKQGYLDASGYHSY